MINTLEHNGSFLHHLRDSLTLHVLDCVEKNKRQFLFVSEWQCSSMRETELSAMGVFALPRFPPSHCAERFICPNHVYNGQKDLEERRQKRIKKKEFHTKISHFLFPSDLLLAFLWYAWSSWFDAHGPMFTFSSLVTQLILIWIFLCLSFILATALKCWRCSSDASGAAFCQDPFEPDLISENQKRWSYVDCSLAPSQYGNVFSSGNNNYNQAVCKKMKQISKYLARVV